MHGRRPSREELADALGTTVERAARARGRDPRLRPHLAEHARPLDDETTIERIDTLVSEDRALDPEHATARDRGEGEVPRAPSSACPQREREIAVLLYVKNLTLREIGDILGVSESRVCQIHGQLKKTLREELDRRRVLFSEVA